MPHTDEIIQKFRSKVDNSRIKFIVAHDSYLINLCASSNDLLKKSRIAFVDELSRCEQLGIPFLNFHPGAHTGRGEDEGIKVIAESINIAHEKTNGYKVKSMLELTAGQGTAIGYRFEHIASIIELIEKKELLSVCIDTAHIFAAGYNIKNSKSYRNVINEFDEIIGLERLNCIHMNDTKKELGSRVDRHEHIGEGFIGLDGFSNLMNDKKLEDIPKILETPKGKEQLEDLKNLEVLKQLIR